MDLEKTRDLTRSAWNLFHWCSKDQAAGSAGFVVCLGDKLMPMGAGRVCLPLSMLWSFR